MFLTFLVRARLTIFARFRDLRLENVKDFHFQSPIIHCDIRWLHVSFKLRQHLIRVVGLNVTHYDQD